MSKIICTIPHEAFNPEVIIQSGQVFRMWKHKETYYALSGDKSIWFQKIDCKTWEFHTNLNDWINFWWDYFDFSSDYSGINTKIMNCSDDFLKKSLENSQGMRILKQDLWETIITFIISQQNNIPKIGKTISILCSKFGTKHEATTEMIEYYSFPTAEQIANLRLSDLQNGTMLGYRAEYILKFAQAVQNEEINLNSLFSLNYEEAMRKLQTIKGIGLKVSNCICLYGLHLMESYPIDTWMSKIISQDYAQFTQEEYLFYINSEYKSYQGYIQQLQFFYKRNFK